MFLPEVVKLLLVLKIFDRGSRQPSQILRMFPALSKSAIAQWNQGAHRNEASIAMLFVGLFLDKSAHACVCAMNEVDKVLAHAMQARREALVLDSVQINAREAFLPGYGIPWEGQYNVTSYKAAGARDSPHLLVEDHLEKRSDGRCFGLGHCSSLILTVHVVGR